MSEKLLLSQKDAAKALGIGAELLRELVRAGKIETVAVGKRQLFSRTALEAFANGGRDA
jgi:excisionase family DNA binding protein